MPALRHRAERDRRTGDQLLSCSVPFRPPPMMGPDVLGCRRDSLLDAAAPRFGPFRLPDPVQDYPPGRSRKPVEVFCGFRVALESLLQVGGHPQSHDLVQRRPRAVELGCIDDPKAPGCHETPLCQPRDPILVRRSPDASPLAGSHPQLVALRIELVGPAVDPPGGKSFFDRLGVGKRNSSALVQHKPDAVPVIGVLLQPLAPVGAGQRLDKSLLALSAITRS